MHGFQDLVFQIHSSTLPVSASMEAVKHLLVYVPRYSAYVIKLPRPVDLFVLIFYGPVNPMGSCRARSVYLTTRLLGRLSPLSGQPVLCTFFRQKLTTALLESAEGRE